MLTKIEFMILFEKIIDGVKVSDEKFAQIIDILKCQNLVPFDYKFDDQLTQVQNILKIIQSNSIKFYELYLGQ
ncbi:hypothetical protein [Clostridium botulinum]|uniref:hypothetical protein n=1 Tax=Clostridium botulinum TaxID=1491 RepID=UPI0013FE7A12|nr:hypothetical protein [Clostridium botulinum]MBY6918183.1 hypothetical protein [Clostridium botulinum]NFQ39439.1 hypothetical protein [Clostridium botulinum]